MQISFSLDGNIFPDIENFSQAGDVDWFRCILCPTGKKKFDYHQSSASSAV